MVGGSDNGDLNKLDKVGDKPIPSKNGINQPDCPPITFSADQDRRVKRKMSITLDIKNDKFIREVLLPNNKGETWSSTINACITAVRKENGY